MFCFQFCQNHDQCFIVKHYARLECAHVLLCWGGVAVSSCFDCSQYLPCFVGVSSFNSMGLLFCLIALFSLFVVVFALFLGVVVGLMSVGSTILRFSWKLALAAAISGESTCALSSISDAWCLSLVELNLSSHFT